MRWLVVLIAMAGCSGHETTCEEAAAPHALVAGMLREQCELDHWSAAARACVARAVDGDILPACRDALGQANTDHLVAATTVHMEPDPNAGPPPPPGPSIVVEVGASTVVVEGRTMDDVEIDALFRQAFAHDPRTQIILHVPKDMRHGRVVWLMERAKAAGLTHLALGDVR